MNYTSQQRLQLFNRGDKEVRLLIKDCDELETRLVTQARGLNQVIKSQQATIVTLQKQVKDLMSEKVS